MRTRNEHLDWCKTRALEYVDSNDIDQAMASMLSYLGKHPETVTHPGKALMASLRLAGHLKTTQSMRDFIEGFN